MSPRTGEFLETLATRFGGAVKPVPSICGESTLEVEAAALLEVCRFLRDDESTCFEQLIDVAGVDYLEYGLEEWNAANASSQGFSRGVSAERGPSAVGSERRFAAVYHLLSVAHNRRLRLRAFCEGIEPPMLDSVVGIWSSADWFEREAFDLFGILFRGHPDLRRLLTDYGFVGHPFRKDFPLIGNVEVRYDPEQRRVIYEPVQIEPRTLVPRVIRSDNRYDSALKDTGSDG